MKKLFIVCVALIQISFASAQEVGQSSDKQSLKYQMLHTLDFIEQLFITDYAMHEWKNEYSGWSLDKEVSAARAKVSSGEVSSIKDFHQQVANIINSTKDYHVSVSFHSTEQASLPLTIHGANGKYFIAYINRKKLSAASFPFAVGDEVVQFGERPTAEVVAELKAAGNDGSKYAAQRIAELQLTRRRASRGMANIPSGPVTLEIFSQARGKASTHQLVWEYTAEKVLPGASGRQLAIPKSSKSTLVSVQKNSLEDMPGAIMLSDFAMDLTEQKSEDKEGDAAPAQNPWQIGGRSSFIPALGNIIWRSAADAPFDAYIYQDEKKRLIGYVRIFGYIVPDYDKYINHFIELVKKFQTQTDALVIDQINNPGGSVFYLYALASLLTDTSLYTPQHRMTVTQASVAQAIEAISVLQNVVDDETAQKVFGGATASGFPVNYQVARMALGYFQFIVDEWNAGRTLTNPYYIWGADRINPHPQAQFTKPILILTNGLDFSGGDFFPAIMQDNERVTILGTNTAGAGGYVHSHSFPNRLGVAGIRLTGSYAKRIDNNPIENLGVQPDIEYELSENDFKQGYQEYKAAILKAVDGILGGEAPSPEPKDGEEPKADEPPADETPVVKPIVDAPKEEDGQEEDLAALLFSYWEKLTK